MPRRNHDIFEVIEVIQAFDIHLEQTIECCLELDFAFLYRCRLHAVILTDSAQDLRCFIFMQHRRILLPDIDMVLAQRKQYRNVFFLYDMSLAETCILRDSTDDLRNIMAKHLSHSIHGAHTLHFWISPLCSTKKTAFLIFVYRKKSSLHVSTVKSLLLNYGRQPRFHDSPVSKRSGAISWAEPLDIFARRPYIIVSALF